MLVSEDMLVGCKACKAEALTLLSTVPYEPRLEQHITAGQAATNTSPTSSKHESQEEIV